MVVGSRTQAEAEADALLREYHNAVKHELGYEIAQAPVVPLEAIQGASSPEQQKQEGLTQGIAVPLEALQGASSPEQLKQEGFAQSIGNAPLGGPVPGLGGPMSSGPTPSYETQVLLKPEYQNAFGTRFGGEINTSTGAFKGNVQIPIGAAENGHSLSLTGSYTPSGVDYMGIRKPAGFGGSIGYTKRNPVDPKVFEKPGAMKYDMNLGVEGVPTRVPPERQIPVQVFPGPGF